MTHTIFDKATLSLGTISAMSKVALMAGSSQQGKALRASVAWMRTDRETGHKLRFCVFNPDEVRQCSGLHPEMHFKKETQPAWVLFESLL